MNLSDCYHLLGLTSEAKLEEIKASYRRLARQYHPDVNPGNREAQAKFIQVTQAYKLLLGTVMQTPPTANPVSQESSSRSTRVQRSTRKAPSPPISELSPVERKLKLNSYTLLQDLLKQRRFARAVALIEGLAQRIPQDPEVRQWQAITYQQWGRHLIHTGELEKARIYLKKALRTDPHNRSLWAEVERDFLQLEQAYQRFVR